MAVYPVALMVAEKPSLALSLAKILSNGSYHTRSSMSSACPVHEFKGDFKGKPTRFKMTSVCGHVMSTDFPAKYNNWDRVDPSDLFDCETLKIEATPKLRIPDFLRVEAKNADYLILWLDCDKEGENICFEVINIVSSVMTPRRDQSIFRAKFSAITDQEIKGAFKKLTSPNKQESLSVDARQQLDLRIGCAFTRFQTKFFHGKYGDLDSSLISFGPCQTPTLGLCVDRHDAIQGFVPEPYWTLQTSVKLPTSMNVLLEYTRGRIFDKETANVFAVLVKASQYGVITKLEEKEKAKQRPLALNTVELMKAASSKLGISPHTAMLHAERLYTMGFISYPRTETTHYSSTFDLKGVVRSQTSSSEWGDLVFSILHGPMIPRKGVDAGDHPPITPMRVANRSDLTGDMWRIYEYITRHFLASVSEDCKYRVKTAFVDISGEEFILSGREILKNGWMDIMPGSEGAVGDDILPPVSKGDKLQVESVKVEERLTSPPDYLSEAELISLMEKHGIGTDASISVHINNICQRNYVTVTGGRRLIPTTLGIVLVHGYKKIDADLVLPTMRSCVEEQLNLIASDKADFNEVLNHTLHIFRLKFLYFVKEIVSMDDLFEVSFSPLSETGKPMSRCGKCRRYMKYIQQKPHRLHCKTCNDTYSLPPVGTIHPHNNISCPLDNFDLLAFTSHGKSSKNFTLCPFCYNNPPFGDMRKGMGCNECTEPTCLYAGTGKMSVQRCSQCDRGNLVLDPLYKWRFCCNKCPNAVRGFKGAISVKVLSELKCPQCGSSTLHVEYNDNAFPGGVKTRKGCISCDPVFASLTSNTSTVQITNARIPHRGRGRGRGRGGRGRGR